MTEGTASKLIKVYQRYVVEYRIDSDTLAKVPWTKLYSLLPLIEGGDDAKEKVESLALMSRRDVEEEIREIKHPNCAHEWITVEKCIRCHKTQKTYE
jgi:hypothetical protein